MSKRRKYSFIELCVQGNALLEEIDDFIDKWHESSSTEELHEFLGMTWKEYCVWVSEPDLLPFIVTAHSENKDLDTILDGDKTLRLAARADSPETAKKIISWLKSKGIAD